MIKNGRLKKSPYSSAVINNGRPKKLAYFQDQVIYDPSNVQKDLQKVDTKKLS